MAYVKPSATLPRFSTCYFTIGMIKYDSDNDKEVERRIANLPLLAPATLSFLLLAFAGSLFRAPVPGGLSASDEIGDVMRHNDLAAAIKYDESQSTLDRRNNQGRQF